MYGLPQGAILSTAEVKGAQDEIEMPLPFRCTCLGNPEIVKVFCDI